jgi:hypothetical protein
MPSITPLGCVVCTKQNIFSPFTKEYRVFATISSILQKKFKGAFLIGRAQQSRIKKR